MRLFLVAMAALPALCACQSAGTPDLSAPVAAAPPAEQKASPRSVDLLLWEPSGVTRPQWPVTQGVPFPAGLLPGADGLWLTDGDRPIPLDARVTCRWPDGAVRWLLVDFQTDIPFSAKKIVTLHWPGPPPGTGHLVTTQKGAKVYVPDIPKKGPALLGPGFVISEGDGSILVQAGRLSAAFRDGGRLPFERLLCGTPPRHVFSPDAALLTLQVGGTTYAARGDSVKFAVESRNSLRLVVRGDAVFTAADGARSLDVTTRVTLYAGLPWLRLHHTITNRTGADVRIERMSIDLPLDAAGEASGWVAGEALAETVFPAEDGAVRLRTRTETAPGTEKNIDDSAFRAEHGANAASFKGHTERQARPFFFLRAGRDPARAEEPVAGPNRLSLTTGAAHVDAGGLNVTLHVRHFWDMAPQALAVDGARATLDLYAGDGEEPLEFWRGTAVTHEAILRVEPGEPVREKERVLALKRFLVACEEPLAPLTATPHWAEDSLAFGPLLRYQPDRFPWIEVALRKTHDTLRWSAPPLQGSTVLDFGDTYLAKARGGQWKNNEEDTGGSLLFQMVRSGYPTIFWQAEPRIMHMMDVDTIHEAATPGWVGGQRYHSAKHGATKPPQPDHQWLEGPLYYYYLTGYERAREIAEARADHFAALIGRGEHRNKGLARTQGWPLVALTLAHQHFGHQRYLDACESVMDWLEEWLAEDGDLVYPQYSEVIEELGGGILGQGVICQGLMHYHEQTGSARAWRLLEKIIEQTQIHLMSPEGLPYKNGSLRRNYYAPGEEMMTFIEPLVYYAQKTGRADLAEQVRRMIASSMAQADFVDGKASPIVYRFLLPALGRADRLGWVKDAAPGK